MNAVWFIFAIGLANACLGFAIASHLGRRYRASIPPDWDFDDGVSWADNPGETPSAEVKPDQKPASEEVEETSTVVAATESGADLPDESLEPIPDPELIPSASAVESDSSPSARGEEADAAAAALEVAAQAAHDGVVADAVPRHPASPSSGDKAIEAFLSEVGQYHEQLGQADMELRAQAEDPDSDSIRACLESLLEASREFAEQREQARAGLGDIWGETSEFGSVRDRLEGAFEQQDAQIDSTERAIAAFPYVDDLTQGCRVMMGESTKLIDVNLRVRDTLQEAGVELARRENRLTDLEPARLRDALTGAESRESLEGALLQWMQGDDARREMLSVAAIDIDRFGRVNEEFGHAVGNQLLHAFGKLLIAENGNRVRVARSGSERFVLLFPGSDLRTTTNAVERLRQIVELACFEYKDAEIRITLSCGVAEAVGEDTPDGVMARAEATLMEAKRYGRNRTFIHEGKYPTPVVPPKFPIEQRRMTL